MVDRTERTVRDWLSQWQLTRLHSVVTGHADNQNAAKLALMSSCGSNEQAFICFAWIWAIPGLL